MMLPFKVFEEPLSPRMIVEASAGTGKTHTITDLFIRLLVEKGLTIEQILVVTFTRMAARELKERIQSRLYNLLQRDVTGVSDGSDPSLENLFGFTVKQTGAIERLKTALLNFDDVQVYTIHGFCQRILNDQALTCRSPFELEVREGSGPGEVAVRDFWRNFINRYSTTEPGIYFIQKAQQIADTPLELLKTINPLLEKPYAIREPDAMADPIPFLSQVIEIRNNIGETWASEKEVILKQLVESNIKGMGKIAVTKIGKSIDKFVKNSDYTIDAPANLHRITSSFLRDDRNLTKSGNRKPEHPFFDYCEVLHSLAGKIPEVQTMFLIEASVETSRRIEKSTRDASELTYDALLFRLNSALSHHQTGHLLAESIRKAFPCALVDEFQDTDPLQYEIFNAIYPADGELTSLMMIGDPKQAIYGFRGADVYAYLNARESAKPHSRYTLANNYRSSTTMIEAVNSLYSVSARPFIDENIQYQSVSKGEDSPVGDIRYDDQNPASLQFHYMNGIHSKEWIRKYLYDSLCNQVAELVYQGNRNRVKIEDRALSAGDIAVLVHSNRDASRIKDLLRERGVGAVIYSRDKILATVEAAQLERLLTAVLDPGNSMAVSTALSTGLFGSSVEQMHHLMSVTESRQDFINLLFELKKTWIDKGIYTMYRRLLIGEGALQNLAEQYNSERVITNLQHLVELASAEEVNNELDPAGLLRWFKSRLQNSGNIDQQELRLENDSQLVKILTIHNSKGLEFPVVFCASLWEASSGKSPVSVYHDPERSFATVVNLNQKKGGEADRASHLESLEKTGEEVRKGYVAVTRAKYECRIFWASAKQSHLSAIGAAVLGREKVASSLADNSTVKEEGSLTDESFLDLFRKLSATSGGRVTLHECDKNASGHFRIDSQLDDKPELKSRKLLLPDRILSGKRLYSYSSLVHNEQVVENEHINIQRTETDVSDSRNVNDEELPDGLSLFNFPKGAHAGTVVHKIFEHPQLVFSSPGLSQETIVEILETHGFDTGWTGTLQKMIKEVINANYGIFQLNSVSSGDSIREMEFRFSTGSLSEEKIISLIRPGSIDNTSPEQLTGYMTGFIDLIIMQNDRFYILDYKSNFLGNLYEDYEPRKLEAEMVTSKYDLQYHIYTLALVRYLRQRMKHFDYDAHFGGVCYLFVRGMRSGSRNGIFFHKPDAGVINRLDIEIGRND